MKFRNVIVLLLFAAHAMVAAADPLDVVLYGGMIFDGSGAPGYVADVGISGDRITAVGDLSTREAARRIDVTGLAVTPGFVDIHSHAVRRSVEKSGIFLWPDAENYIRQGATTVIGGPDGGSELSVANLLSDLEKTPAAINFGTFIGTCVPSAFRACQ